MPQLWHLWCNSYILSVSQQDGIHNDTPPYCDCTHNLWHMARKGQQESLQIGNTHTHWLLPKKSHQSLGAHTNNNSSCVSSFFVTLVLSCARCNHNGSDGFAAVSLMIRWQVDRCVPNRLSTFPVRPQDNDLCGLFVGSIFVFPPTVAASAGGIKRFAFNFLHAYTTRRRLKELGSALSRPKSFANKHCSTESSPPTGPSVRPALHVVPM